MKKAHYVKTNQRKVKRCTTTTNISTSKMGKVHFKKKYY